MKRSKSSHQARHGLTIREAILGIAIFGILLALLFPEPHSAESPQKAQAKNDVALVASAVTAFQTEYGYLPGTNRGEVGGEMLAALLGSNTTLNPRQLVFLELNPAKPNKSGITNGVFVDPWGGAYQIAFAAKPGPGARGEAEGRPKGKVVFVWTDPSLGRDAARLSEAEKARRYVDSWE